jgi:hypothetical protein
VTRRLLTAAALILLVVVVPGSTSAALPCDPEAPPPRRPDHGAAGWFTTVPTAQHRPAPGHPTGREDLFATYGTAGLWWPTWDLGCTGQWERIGTDIANLPMGWSNAALAATHSIRVAAWSDYLLDGIDRAAADFTARLAGWFATAMGMALTVVGVWMLWRAHHAEAAGVAAAAGWAVAMITVGALALAYPTWAAQRWDDMAVGTGQLVSSTIAGDQTDDPVVSQINADVAYEVWLRGMFGSDSSRTATEYGPRFYAAMAVPWSEVDDLDGGGERARSVIESHRQAFVAAADDLERDDPDAYRVMQGKDPFSTRIPTSLIGMLLVFLMCFLAGVGAVLLLAARIVGRGLVMAAPLVIPFGTLHRWNSPVRRLAGIAQAVVVAMVFAIIGGAVLTRLVGALLASDWPMWLVGGTAAVASYVGWRALRPVGTIAGLVGLAGLSRAPRRLLTAAIVGIVGGATAGATVVAAGRHVDSDDEPEVRAEEWSAPPPSDVPALPAAEPFDPSVIDMEARIVDGEEVWSVA